MDAVELPYPVDVVAPKLMGSEGFGRAGVGVTVTEVDACESNQDSVFTRASTERFSTYLRQKDVISIVDASETVSHDKIPETECKDANSLPRFLGEHVAEQLQSRGNNYHLLPPKSESVLVHRKVGKVSRSSNGPNGCSKRQRLAQPEDAINSAGVIDIKYPSDRLASNPRNFNSSDATGAINPLQSVSCDKISDPEICKHAKHLCRFQDEHMSEQLLSQSTTYHLLPPKSESVQAHRKLGKVSRSSNGCSKRPRMVQLEDPSSPVGVDDIKDMSDLLNPYPMEFLSSEKSQLIKQKNNFSSKRADKKNSKVPVKPKFESFPLKAGFANFSSAAGGSNFLGAYGLKSDIHDVTKLVDDLLLNELLDGTYEPSSLGREKGKKAANVNENIILSIRKACSILPLSRPVKKSLAEVDSCSNQMTMCISTTVVSGDKRDSCTVDLCSCDKIQDSSSMPETPANALEFPLYDPKDVLERLALPPPKNLETLLLDATKPVVSSKGNDLRSGKQISRRVSLPPFPWSHNGHCRTSSDAVKLLTSRSTCQGRWARIGNAICSSVAVADCFVHLDSLTYDDNLVPSGVPKLVSLDNKIVPCMSYIIPLVELGTSSAATCSEASYALLDSGNQPRSQETGGECPRVIEAAQTLCDIAGQSYCPNPDGTIRWPKKPSQKTTKAQGSKSVEKAEVMHAPLLSVFGSVGLVRSRADQTLPSKRPKLSTSDNKRDISQADSLRKGPINWSTPRLSRSSPGKSLRDSITEKEQSVANIVKRPCMLPPPSRVVNKVCNSQQKVRKLTPTDLNRRRDRVD